MGYLQARLLARGKTRGDEMRVGITGQEKELEDEKACSPDGGRAAEQRQDLLAEQELYLKQEKGAEEDGHRKKKLQQRAR